GTFNAIAMADESTAYITGPYNTLMRWTPAGPTFIDAGFTIYGMFAMSPTEVYMSVNGVDLFVFDGPQFTATQTYYPTTFLGNRTSGNPCSCDNASCDEYAGGGLVNSAMVPNPPLFFRNSVAPIGPDEALTCGFVNNLTQTPALFDFNALTLSVTPRSLPADDG